MRFKKGNAQFPFEKRGMDGMGRLGLLAHQQTFLDIVDRKIGKRVQKTWHLQFKSKISQPPLVFLPRRQILFF
jgi:hypothetical protein